MELAVVPGHVGPVADLGVGLTLPADAEQRLVGLQQVVGHLQLPRHPLQGPAVLRPAEGPSHPGCHTALKRPGDLRAT